MLTRPTLTAPETPYILSGLFLGVAAYKKRGTVDNTMFKGLLASVALVLLASYSAGTQYAQVIRAFGYLVFLAALSVTVRSFAMKAVTK